MKPVFRNVLRAAAVATASLALAGAAQAQWHGHGGYRGGWHGGGGWHGAPWVWGGVGLGLGLGLASVYSAPYYGYYAAPTYVYTPPPTVVYTQPVPAATPVPAAGYATPVIYPRNGQTAAQRERDSDQCSEWAGQQPNATSDRSIFNRAVAACMDARGYTLR